MFKNLKFVACLIWFQIPYLSYWLWRLRLISFSNRKKQFLLISESRGLIISALRYLWGYLKEILYRNCHRHFVAHSMLSINHMINYNAGWLWCCKTQNTAIILIEVFKKAISSQEMSICVSQSQTEQKLALMQSVVIFLASPCRCKRLHWMVWSETITHLKSVFKSLWIFISKYFPSYIPHLKAELSSHRKVRQLNVPCSALPQIHMDF